MTGTVYLVLWYDPSEQRVCCGGAYAEIGNAVNRLEQVEQQERDGKEKERGMPIAGLRTAILNVQ